MGKKIIAWYLFPALFCFIEVKAQQVITLSDQLDHHPIDVYSLSGFIIGKSVIEPHQIDSHVLSGQINDFESVNAINKFILTDYFIHHILVIENPFQTPKWVYLRSQHTPIYVYRRKPDTIEIIPFTGHSAAKLSSSPLSFKTRNTALFSLSPHTRDTIFYITRYIEAGESKELNLGYYETLAFTSLSKGQWINLFNGIFLGILLTFLFSSLYFYLRIRERFLLWYMIYVSIFLFYYWRDLEFWNVQLDYTHKYISWFVTKGPITYFIFLFYLLFVNSILNLEKVSLPRKFLTITAWSIPILMLIDYVLLYFKPYWSISFTYFFGVIVGVIQLYIIFPLWNYEQPNRTSNLIIAGSICIFIGWLSILFLEENIHQYTVRVFTLFEFVFFTIAIVENFIRIRNEANNALLYREQALSKERERISAELHDELGSTISGISLYSYLAESQFKNNDSHSGHQSLNVIIQQANDVINKLYDIIWLTKPDQDQLEQIFHRLEELLTRMCKAKSINPIYRLQIELHTISQIQLSITQKKSLYLIVKEAINNAVKHSQAKDLVLSIYLQNRQLIIDCSDNGTGMLFRTKDIGNGLANIDRRAKESNFNVSINSNSPSGTRLSLIINLSI